MTSTLTAVVPRLQSHRRIVASLVYGMVAVACYAGAYLLRFEFRVPEQYARLYFLTVPLLVVVRLATYWIFRLSAERWRYTGSRDIARLVLSTAAGSGVFVLGLSLVSFADRVPLSVIVMEAFLTAYGIGAVWFAYRSIFERARRAHRPEVPQKRTIIIGAGEAGNLLVREMLRSPTHYEPIGLVDENPVMWGATIHGLKVFGSIAELPTFAAQYRADKLIIAIPSAPPADLRRIVRSCEETGLPFKVLPGISDVIHGNVSLQQVRDVRIEDLLGREPITLALPELSADLSGCTVLITGAAGSIGSELARQVALHEPETLVLLDQAETPLYYLELELRAKHPDLRIAPVIADIVDGVGMARVFEQYSPERVFHAAAYKHVPMMEGNAREAVRNNVGGTLRVAELAGQYGVERFVLVSTDKAVRPTNVMGATKRVAELVVLELQQRFPGTTYCAVRFGNVLGSQGSVIPVFRQQLAEGRPLTVTHPETTRYFMTIPEAVQLILQASLLPDLRGRIAMLEMGEPVRIVDLALNLLRLSGILHGPDHIVFTGLRPGEKLHEELSAPDEQSEPTSVSKVWLLRTPAIPVLGVLARTGVWNGEFDEGVLVALSEMFPDVDAAAITTSRHMRADEGLSMSLRARA